MKTHIYILAAALLTTSAGCKKTFFNRPPEDQPTVGTYYQTTDQVQSSTAILYAAPWFGLNGKAFLAIGDLQSGNAICYAGTDGAFDAFRNFSQGNATQGIQSAWNSLYTVVAQANALLNNLPTAAPASVPKDVVNNALGEAHVMRAAAYFDLVRLFGNVPIITDPTQYVGSFQSVPTNPVADVYKFMINDLKFGEANCRTGTASTGHVSSASASGLMAKVYLYMQDYANARTEAEKAINSGEFGLMGLDFPGSYAQLFEFAGNNSKESMIALQWTSNGGYGFGNQLQSVIAASSDITGTSDGYGELGPSWDLQDAFTAAGDSVRRHGCIMLGGDHYAELHKKDGGYTVPLNINAQGSHAGMKKYVVGTPDDNNGYSAKQATSNNTYILRYADIYLIEAEAILGTAAGARPGTGIPMNASTADATALKYINLVRQRAMLPALTSLTYQQLINERRLEFAIEGEYWYDLQRLDGFNNPHHPTAIAIISQQNRGDSDGAGTAANNYTDYHRNTLHVTPSEAAFLLPIPATETAADPALLQPPVPYKF
ncbi:RagB/SusD family nutrient uptake outer membrane protein [Puia sp. P3]|uniref:RagB/SusD family nutrient uptake outer membrane protein n=1 Tax=Puia sp. P3 TaxID=3423952 RepID=UPI003D664BD4